MASRTLPILVVLLVVLAGCSGGPATGPTDATTTDAATTDREPATTANTTTGEPDTTRTTDAGTTTAGDETTTDPGRVVTEGFDPAYDPVTVLERVESLRGVTASERITVTVEDLPDYVAANETERPPRRFFDLTPLGVKTLQYASTEERVAVASPGSSREGYSVALLAAEPLEARYGLAQETVLAHEYVHVLQREAGVFDVPIDPETTDATFTLIAVVEGDALVVERQYHERYLDGDRDGRFFTVEARNETPSRSRWRLGLANAAYYEGYRYHTRVADGPSERNAVLRNPPNTSAEVLHPNRSLDVPGDPVPAPSVSGYEVNGRDRVGELAIRYALRLNEVPYGEASEAAEGWRNDSLVTYYDAGPEVVYWGTRWASAAEAEEFARAWREMLEDLGATRNDSVLTVPGTATTPEMHYAVVVDDSVVHVVAAEESGPVRDVVDEVGAWNATSTSGSLASCHPKPWF